MTTERKQYPVKVTYTKTVTSEAEMTTAQTISAIEIAHHYYLSFLDDYRPWEERTLQSIEVAGTVFTLEELKAHEAEKAARE